MYVKKMSIFSLRKSSHGQQYSLWLTPLIDSSTACGSLSLFLPPILQALGLRPGKRRGRIKVKQLHLHPSPKVIRKQQCPVQFLLLSRERENTKVIIVLTP